MPPSDRPSASSAPAGPVTAGHVGAVLLGLVLLALAVPRLAAALVELPGDRVLQTLRAGVPVTDAALEAAADTRALSLRLIETADTRRELGALLHTRAVRDPDAPDARAPAGRALADGLARAPLDPFAWTRLATLATLDDRPEDALRALRASWAAAPYEPALTALRLRLALAHWPLAGDTERRILATEARHLWRADPEALAALAAEHPRARRLLRAALGEEGEELGLPLPAAGTP
jgi:hypothetical protein